MLTQPIAETNIADMPNIGLANTSLETINIQNFNIANLQQEPIVSEVLLPNNNPMILEDGLVNLLEESPELANFSTDNKIKTLKEDVTNLTELSKNTNLTELSKDTNIVEEFVEMTEPVVDHDNQVDASDPDKQDFTSNENLTNQEHSTREERPGEEQKEAEIIEPIEIMTTNNASIINPNDKFNITSSINNNGEVKINDKTINKEVAEKFDHSKDQNEEIETQGNEQNFVSEETTNTEKSSAKQFLVTEKQDPKTARLDSFEDVIDQIKIQLHKLSDEKDKKITVQLHPEDLGKVDIKIETNVNGRNLLTFTAEKPDTMHMLQRDSSILEKILDDAGIKPDSTTMSFNLNNSNQNEQQRLQEIRNYQNQISFLEEDEDVIATYFGFLNENERIDIMV